MQGETEWQQFRTGFAASRLFTFLLGELNEIAPDYGAELHSRLNRGIAAGEGFADADPRSDGPALIPGLAKQEPTMMDLSTARLLEEQLFPERQPHDSRDFHQTTRGMATAALHSVLEKYATAIGATLRRTPLPKAVDRFLAAKGALSADLADALTEFDETRHSLSADDLDRYYSTVWRIALALRLASQSDT